MMTDDLLRRSLQRGGGCRLCMAPDTECVPIFATSAADKEPLSSKIMSCVSIKVSRTCTFKKKSLESTEKSNWKSQKWVSACERKKRVIQRLGIILWHDGHHFGFHKNQDGETTTGRPHDDDGGGVVVVPSQQQS